MLMSAELPLPDNILTTGFFTADGQKMSKSIGNVVDPVAVVGEYGRDFLVNYLLGAFPIGNDGDFSMKEAKLMFNNRLANNIGNLLNRFLVLSLKLSTDQGNTARVEITEPIYDVAGDPE
jgi:methionyl-tRNA synthetase